MAEVCRPGEKPGTAVEIHVQRLGANEKLNVVIFSPRTWAFMIHWNPHRGKKGRSEPHLMPADQCPGCAAGLRPKWLGYLYVAELFQPKPNRFFLELSQGADDWLQRYLPAGESLRGKAVKISRGNGKSTRLTVEPLMVSIDPATLLDDIDPLETLEKMWAIGLPQRQRIPEPVVKIFSDIG